MRKIIHLIDTLDVGGAQTQLLNIIKHFNYKNYEHMVYSLTDKLTMSKEFLKASIPVFSLGLDEALKKRRWFQIINQITSMLRKEKPDILEMHLSWSRIFGTIGSVLTGKITIISFEHGDLYKGWKYCLVNFILSFFINKIIACSYALKYWLIKNYKIPSRKILVMHNAVSLEEFKPVDINYDRRMEFGFSKNNILIVSVGTLGKGINKGMDYLIRAVSELIKKNININLLIVGEGELKEELIILTNELGILSAVKFLGKRRDIKNILNIADIFVLASIFEPFGIAIIEAMAMAKPVIATNSGGIPEIIRDGENGLLVEPRDYHTITEKIEILINKPDLRKRLGEEARKTVIAKFNIQQFVKNLEELYAEIKHSIH